MKSPNLEELEILTHRMINPKKVNILMVDDDEVMCKLLARHFRSVGYPFDFALSLTSGLQKLYADSNTGLLLLDLSFPNGNGLSVLKQIKENSPLVKTVILTGAPTFEDQILAFKNGAVAFISKPFSLFDLTRIIKDAI